MASASATWSEENFSCSICLDVFSSPVTTPCGHNFCKTCITKFWDEQVRCKCPVCNELYPTRPDLRVNTFISEMAAHFRMCVQEKEQHCVTQVEQVPCDVCTGTQLKAVKSCLVCLTSYCHDHLEPHQRVERLKKHTLIDPVDRLEDRMCKKHGRILELFCKVEQVCVCQFCTETDHKFHPAVPLKEEYDVKKAQLEKMESELQQMIEERQQKIQAIKHTVEFSKEDANREIADGVQVFTALMHRIEKCQMDLNKTIKEKLKSTERRADDLIKELEREIKDLTNKSAEVKQLLHTGDLLHVVRTFSSLEVPPGTGDQPMVEVSYRSYVGTLRGYLVQLVEALKLEMKKLHGSEMRRLTQHMVDVSLDPQTAHPKLVLSEDGKQVHIGDELKELPEEPKRFTENEFVLTKQSFSVGRFYFEIEGENRTDWGVGLARGSIDRKGDLSATIEDGLWTIWCINNRCIIMDTTEAFRILGPKLTKVGVFVDYDGGLISFYDVEARVHIHSFTGCTFGEPLYPVLSLNDGDSDDDDDNSAPGPLIISSVYQAD